MKAVRIPLQPHSHFHFGEFKIDSNVALSSTSVFAHSDTLFSALVNSYFHGVGEANDFVGLFSKSKICISSLYYYLKKDDTVVYLLPKPVFLDLYSPRDGEHKLRNQIKFVSAGVWQKGFTTKDWTDATKDYCFIQNHDILLTSKERDELGLNAKDHVFSVVDIPKSPIRKADPNQSIYYQTDVEVGKIKDVEIGFYFLYNADSDAELELKRAVNVLVYSGIGGEKNNTGRVMQEPKYDNFDLNLVQNKKDTPGFTNISLLNPADAAELKKVIYSQTKLRGGRKSGKDDGEYEVVRMINEGALLNDKDIRGRLVAIGTDIDNNKVYRNGLAFVLPLIYYKSNE